VRRCSERLSRCTSMEEALNAALSALTDFLGVQHAMILMHDSGSQRLYTVASCGYPTSGVGSEIGMGHGVIGVAARQETPVRITHMTNAYLYSQAMRSSFESNVPDLEAMTEIPYPGLAQPRSQLAVPVLSAGRLLGVLFAESPNDMQFGFEDEDVLVAIAGHLGATIDLLQEDAAQESDPVRPELVEGLSPGLRQARPERMEVRHYTSNDSVFVGDSYLIKGVAGAILWKLLKDHVQHGRTEFSNRELRLDPAIPLPDVSDNLEARLVLLRRRLDEHGPDLRIEKTGRGRFRLLVHRPVALAEA
jgi:adenylate cyclase